MKKNGIIRNVLILGAVLILTACGNTNDTEHNNSENLEKDTNVSSSPYMIDNFSEQPLNLSKYSLDYELETDDQTYFSQSKITKSKFGYYYFNSYNLMFYDIQSKREVLLCNQADCNHSDSDCHAYFVGQDAWNGYGYSTASLQYYKDAIYLVGYDMDGYTALFKIAEDGSSREKYMDLYKADLTSADGSEGLHWRAPEFCLHRDYVYFIDSKESFPKLRRMKLGGTEAEVIFETTGDYADIYRMSGYGDYIFFQMTNDIYEGGERVEIEGGIFAYNIQTGEIQLVRKDAIATYMIEGNTLYYQYDGTDTKVQSLDLLTQENQLFLDSGDTTEWYVDEHYFYTFSFTERLLSVYDHKGNLVCKVTTAIDNCYFGDGIYLIGQNYDWENKEYLTCIIEASDFADGQADWTFLE